MRAAPLLMLLYNPFKYHRSLFPHCNYTAVTIHSLDLKLQSGFKASLSISHYFVMPYIFLTPYCDGGAGLLATGPLRGGDSI